GDGPLETVAFHTFLVATTAFPRAVGRLGPGGGDGERTPLQGLPPGTRCPGRRLARRRLRARGEDSRAGDHLRRRDSRDGGRPRRREVGRRPADGLALNSRLNAVGVGTCATINYAPCERPAAASRTRCRARFGTPRYLRPERGGWIAGRAAFRRGCQTAVPT